MPKPTFQQLFGQSSGATTDPTGKAFVVMYLEDFASEGLAVPDPVGNLNASSFAAALLIKWLSASLGNDDDPTWGVIVNGARPSLVTRGEATQRELALSASIYTPDNTPLIPDPDLVV